MNGTRLSPDWRPDGNLLAWAKGRRPDLDLEDTIAQFSDYWCAKTGKDATKLDWNATWRNWVRNTRAQPMSMRPKTVSPSPAVETPRLDPAKRHKNVTKFGGYLETLVGQMTKLDPDRPPKPAKPEPRTPDEVLRAAFAGLFPKGTT